MGLCFEPPTKAQETSLKRVWKERKSRKMGRDAWKCCFFDICHMTVVHINSETMVSSQDLHKAKPIKNPNMAEEGAFGDLTLPDELLPVDGCYKMESHFSQRVTTGRNFMYITAINMWTALIGFSEL